MYLFFYFKGVDKMNYFFKYLIPQLLDYFNNDVDSIKEFIPKVIIQNYENTLLECIKNEKESINETIN